MLNFDSSNSDHTKALDYFKITGHPKCKLSLDNYIDDIDLLLRDEVVKKFNIISDYLDEPNGSFIKVANDDPLNFEVYANFSWDDCEEFVKVNGKLKIMDNEAIFVFDSEDIDIINETEFDKI